MSHAALDLERALVGAVTSRPTHVAIAFPRVPLRRAREPVDMPLPIVEAEIRLWHGTIEETVARLPRKLTDWEIRHRHGALRGALPMDFRTSGAVQLTLGFGAGERIVVTGTRLTVRVARRVAQLAPPRRHGYRAARQPKRQLPRSVR